MELLRPKKKDTPPPAPKPVSRPAPPPTRPSASTDDDIDRIKKENKAKEAAQTSTETTTAPSATPVVPAAPVVSTPAAVTTPTAAPIPAVRRLSANPIPAAAPDVAPVRPSRAPATTATTATTASTESSKPSTTTARTNQTSVSGSRFTSRSGSPNSIVNRYAPPQPGYTGFGAGSAPTAQEESPDSDFSSSDTSSSSDSDSDEEEEAADAADDGYEYEYYDEEETGTAAASAASTAAASAPKPTPPSSILKKANDTPSYVSSYGASKTDTGNAYSSSYGAGYGASTPASSSYTSQYGYGASSQPEAPSRNQSAYSSSYSMSDDQPTGRTPRSYTGAKTTSAYGGSWGQDSEPAAPTSPGVSRRYSRYTSPEPTAPVSSERRFSREDSSDSTSYSGRYKRRDDSDSFVSRYLAKSRSTAVGLGSSDSPRDQTPEDSVSATRKISGELQYPSGRSRYAALKERKARLAKSKSSAAIGLGGEDEDDGDEVLTPFTSRFGGELARSRSSHLLKDQNSPSGSRTADASADDENLSSWAKYLKNKYGGRAASNTAAPSASRDSGSRVGLSSRYETDQSKNLIGSPAPTPQQPSAQGSGGIGSMPKSQYLQKQALVLKFGARGSQPGFFTWPRGIAVGADNTIIVADSSNHRVQIFDENGQNRFWLGGYGNAEGEFDCLAGVAVNRIGQYITGFRCSRAMERLLPSLERWGTSLDSWNTLTILLYLTLTE